MSSLENQERGIKYFCGASLTNHTCKCKSCMCRSSRPGMNKSASKHSDKLTIRPFNSAASLFAGDLKNILDLEFVEISELVSDYSTYVLYRCHLVGHNTQPTLPSWISFIGWNGLTYGSNFMLHIPSKDQRKCLPTRQ